MKYSRLILVLSTLILLFLSACGGSKPLVVAPKKTLPTWYTTPQTTTDKTLFGVGEGRNKKDAIANTLSMMVSTLSVSIESKYNSKTVEHQGVKNSYQTTNSSEINADVKKVRISNYELLHAQSMGFNRYIVSIKSDKKKLFESMHSDIKRVFNVVDSRHKNALSYNAIKQLNLYRKSQIELLDTPNTLNIMSELKPSFNSKIYINKIQAIETQYSNLLSKITFSVESNRDANSLKAPLQSGLNAKKLQVKRSKGKYHFRVKINSKTEKASSYGFTLARSAITITTQDYKGHIIASNKLNITGQSTQGYAIAKESVAVKLNALIEKEGITKVLGGLFTL
jgi:hypothetical protein